MRKTNKICHQVKTNQNICYDDDDLSSSSSSSSSDCRLEIFLKKGLRNVKQFSNENKYKLLLLLLYTDKSNNTRVFMVHL